MSGRRRGEAGGRCACAVGRDAEAEETEEVEEAGEAGEARCPEEKEAVILRVRTSPEDSTTTTRSSNDTWHFRLCIVGIIVGIIVSTRGFGGVFCFAPSA